MSTSIGSLRPNNFQEAKQLAELAAKTPFAGAFRGKPADALVAIMFGHEVGLSPVQALSGVAVVNNRPSLYGDSLLAVCRSSPLCEDVQETISGEGDTMVATCTATRRGCQPTTRTFSVDDAKAAGLWKKSGPWSNYPKRMLAMRARSWALRDAFPDLIAGVIAAEEAQDIPAAEPATVTVSQQPAIEYRQEAEPEEALVAKAQAAIAKASTPGVLDRLRARVEQRVLDGDLGATEAEQLLHDIAAKITTLSTEDATDGNDA